MQGFFFEWKPGNIATEASNLHNPEICLNAVGMKLEAELDPITVKIGEKALKAKFYRYDDNGRPLHVFFMMVENNLIGNASQASGSLFRFNAVLEGRRNTGQRLVELGLWDESSDGTAVSTFIEVMSRHFTDRAWLN